MNRAVDEFKLVEPSKILDKVSELIADTFSSSENNDKVNDGMDISLCVFDFDANELNICGANNSAYVVRDGKMTKLVATLKPIGRSIGNVCFTSENWKNEKDQIDDVLVIGLKV